MRTIGSLLLLAMTLAVSATVSAATVHRCIGEHGEIAFSETRCASGRDMGGSVELPSAPATSRSTIGTRSAASPTCPASPDALRDHIAEAFARRDANVFAGVLRWDGISGGAASPRMREIAELTQRPLVGIDLGGAAIEASLGDEPPPATATSMTVRTGGLGGGASEREFRVTASDGCYWLDW